MRKPTVHKTFNLLNNVGVSTVLSTSTNLAEAAQQTVIDNLSILPSGPKPPNPSELLGSSRMNQVMAEAKKLYDIVIFDMPPVVAVTDAHMVQARVLGVVYNGAENNKDSGYYYYYGN